jgi:hypothetical protein
MILALRIKKPKSRDRPVLGATGAFVIIGVFHVVLFSVFGWVIWRHYKKKRWIGGATRFLGRSVYSDFQNADSQERIEHVIYMEEDERDEDFGGEGETPGQSE